VRPTVESLNSLARILRTAEPVYAECRSILNYLEDSEPPIKLEPVPKLADAENPISANNDAACTHQTIVKLEPTPRNRVM
jgi:hypothetical protein